MDRTGPRDEEQRRATAPRADGAARDGAQAARGFVFAATGATYVALARRAARSLKRAMPGAEVDLFTDQPLADPVFAVIHPLGDGFFRPKMEAMRRTRFDRTVMLDADVIVLHPVPELFEMLDRADIAGAPGVVRGAAMGFRAGDVPRAFPVINSGVLAVRRSPRLERFLSDWEAEIRAGALLDQPALRRMLWRRDLRLVQIGYEYNLMHLPFLDRWEPRMGAPRILHVSDLHKREPGDPTLPFDLDSALGPERAALVRWLSAADWSLGGNPDLPRPRFLGLRAALRRLAGRDPRPARLPTARGGGPDG